MDNDQRTYQVGDLISFTDVDPVVTGRDAARDEAQRQYEARADWDDSPVGIWEVDEDDAKLTGIYYQGDLFTP